MNIQLATIKEKAQMGAQRFKDLPKKKKIIISAIAGVLVIVLVLQVALSGREVAQTINTATVDRGNISVVISGTGTIAPIDEYEVTSLVKGEILRDTFQEGDLVEKGDLLYQIDSSDLETNLEKAQLNLEKSQLSYQDTMNELSKLNVASTYSGTITETYVKVGDSVGKGTKIADIINMDIMVLSIPFNATEAETIQIGDYADVNLVNSFYTLAGTVRRVSSGSLISSEGIAVRTVEIEVQNPGAITKGDMATATVGNIACNSPGTFDYQLDTTITAETSGEVKQLICGKGDKVSAGQVVAVLTSSSSASTRMNSQISLRDSQLSIENYNKQLEDYQITSPISGTVLKKTSKAGDTLDNSNSQVVMAVIADMSTITFEMSVDELDISKIEVGQSVSITADAIEGRVYTGYVDYVSVVGTTQNGVTTYPITIVVDNPEDLIPGMNVSAEIMVESRENVLRVPITAVNRGNIVYVKDNGKTVEKKDETMQPGPEENMPDERPQRGDMPRANNVPEGFRAVHVETGLNDSNYIEIVSGLSEGDEVYVPVNISTSDDTMAAMMGGMPGGGMMGGGMPGGR